MTKVQIIKLLAGLTTSSSVVAAIDNLPSPWKQIAAAAIALVGTYVNWASHQHPSEWGAEADQTVTPTSLPPSSGAESPATSTESP